MKLNQQLSNQLNEIEKGYDKLIKERDDRKVLKEAHTNRKNLPKYDPLTRYIYKRLIEYAIDPNYTSVKLRIAFCLLAITRIRINELLFLKVDQLQTLLEAHSIRINSSKWRPTSHKAFLTSEGRKVVKARKRDFEFLFLMKDENSYVFTSDQKPNQKLGRQTITMDVNKVMHSVSNLLPSKPNITSHSFRIGYISQLWKDTKDIEFVRQTIGHRSLNSTSNYVSDISDEERENIMSRI